MALTTTGEWWAFGQNVLGQLALGNTNVQYTPQKIPSTFGGSPISTVSLGLYHSLILTTAGAVYGVGSNSNGQLAQTSFASSTVPILVTFLSPVSITMIMAGYSASGVLLTNGTSITWGGNGYGQLGTGSWQYSWPYPTQVNLSNVTTMTLSNSNGGWITGNGNAYISGDNTFGQLGSSTTLSLSMLPRQVQAPNGLPISSLVMGQENAAIGTATDWYVFGRNEYLQLGLGNTSISIAYLPVLLASPDMTLWTAMSIGAYSYAGQVASGNVYTWGYNFDGELGLGDTVNRATPSLLTTTQAIAQITFGFKHGAVLRAQTATPTPTLTPTFVVCSSSSLSFASGIVTLSATMPCTFALSGGSGSSSWFTRYVALQINDLGPIGLLHLNLLNGCPANAATNCTTCSSCSFDWNSSSIGVQNLLPVSSVSMLSGAGFTAKGSSAGVITVSGSYLVDPSSPSMSVQFWMAYQATALLLGLTCGLTALGVLILTVAAYWTQRRRTHRVREEIWKDNPRMKNWWIVFLLTVGTGAFVLGIAWVVIAALCASPMSLLIGLLVAGAIVAGIGLIIAIGSWLWVVRDPMRLECPECTKPVKRWRFVGTYLPPEGESGQPFRKAHTAHVRCLVCRRPVVTDRWPVSPPMRPYHEMCWDSHCAKCVGDTAAWTAWWAAESSEVTPQELSHLLAAAVEAGSVDMVSRLLAVDPTLPCQPISHKGGRSAIHLAARSGMLHILKVLLQTHPYVLDPVCPFDAEAPCSISIKGAEKDENDLYIIQPQIMYNNNPFFVGHSKGKYVYFYKPLSSGRTLYSEGWCLSAHLGSGCPLYRLPIAQEMNKHQAPSARPFSGESRATPLRRVLKRVNNWLEQRTDAHSVSGRGDGSVKTDDPRGAERKTSVDNARRDQRRELAPARLAENLRLDWVPHSTSVFMDAIASRDEATVLHVARLYQEQSRGCLVWEYDASFGLWKVIPSEQQEIIREAVTAGRSHVHFTTEDDRVAIDLKAMRYRTTNLTNPAIQLDAPLRQRMRAILQTQEKEKGTQYSVTSNVEAVSNWEGAVLVFAPSHAVAHATDHIPMLSLLVREGIADHSLWAPPSLAGTSVEIQRSQLHDVFTSTVMDEITSVFGTDVWKGAAALRRASLATLAARDHREDVDSGIGNRLTDGLETPLVNAEVAFYPPDYTSDTWTLPFCLRLPENPLGYHFPLNPLLKMTEDAIMKVHELRRQNHTINPRNSVALFVYTYEQFDDGNALDQIYGSLNAAMRKRDERMIAFWRPFIWELDQALMALPPYVGKSYRGISCVMDPKVYATSRRICWPSFSSASESRTVAEVFARGDAGTLFFLQSTNAKAIGTVSRFPDEAEVMFAPNSLFEVTSTVTQASDIGQFYGKIDNIAMKQVGGLYVTGTAPRPVGHTSMLVHLPPTMMNAVVERLTNMQSAGIQSLDLFNERDDGISAYVLVRADPGHVFGPPDAMAAALGRFQPGADLHDLLHLDNSLPDPIRVADAIADDDLFLPMSQLIDLNSLQPTQTPQNVYPTEMDWALMPPPRPVPKLQPPPKMQSAPTKPKIS